PGCASSRIIRGAPSSRSSSASTGRPARATSRASCSTCRWLRVRADSIQPDAMAAARPKAIDCWLNPSFRAHDYKPDFLVRVAREYFHREKEMFEVTPLEELLRQMDEAGVERAILTIDPHDPEPYAEVRRAFPGRFILSAMVDPMGGMNTIRVLERA